MNSHLDWETKGRAKRMDMMAKSSHVEWEGVKSYFLAFFSSLFSTTLLFSIMFINNQNGLCIIIPFLSKIP